MKTEVVTITPEMAEKWLAQNVGNRKLRQTTVRYYAGQMKAGLWVLTHQGICRTLSGNLVDGQHRLAAIVQAGVAVRMMVTTLDGESLAEALPLDMGVKRTFSDILSIPKREIEIIRLMQEIDSGDSLNRGTLASCSKVYEVIGDQIRSLPKPVMGAMCAHRVATLLAVMANPMNKDDILDQSAWFACGSNCKQYWASIEAFNQFRTQTRSSHWNGNNGRMDYVLRLRTALLNPAKRSNRIHSEIDAIKEVREQCRQILADCGVTCE